MHEALSQHTSACWRVSVCRNEKGSGQGIGRRREVAMTSQLDDSVPQGDDRGTPPGGRSSTQLTRRGTLRKRRPYRPRRDRGRFRLTPRDEWGMRYIADMWALRFDQLLDMFALWHYQEEVQ